MDTPATGTPYAMQCSDNLIMWHISTTAYTVLSENSEVEIVPHTYPPLPSGNPARFFRVRVSMP